MYFIQLFFFLELRIFCKRLSRVCLGNLHMSSFQLIIILNADYNLYKSNVLSKNTNVRIFNTHVKSVFFNGCETRRLTAGLQHKIQYMYLSTNATFNNKKPLCKMWCAWKLDRTKRNPADAHIKIEHANGLTTLGKKNPNQHN